jgi:hypothetical protein
VLLGPALREIDPALPALAWAAYHGDDAALLRFARALFKAGRPHQARRALELLAARRPASGPALLCERCGSPLDEKCNCLH